MVNNFNFKPAAVAAVLMKDHRTLQQTVMRFCIAYIEAMAKKEIGRDTDMRNEASVRLAKKINEAIPLEDRYVPFI